VAMRLGGGDSGASKNVDNEDDDETLKNVNE